MQVVRSLDTTFQLVNELSEMCALVSHICNNSAPSEIEQALNNVLEYYRSNIWEIQCLIDFLDENDNRSVLSKIQFDEMRKEVIMCIFISFYFFLLLVSTR